MDNEKEGFPVTAIREIKILKVLNHKNIVRLKEIVTSKASEYNHGKGSIYMVMEFSDHDLTGLTDGGQRFTTSQIKCYMKQLLEGIAYCHKNKVLHRDIKGAPPSRIATCAMHHTPTPHHHSASTLHPPNTATQPLALRAGSNLLINNEGQLKLADFGLARPYDTDQQRNYTNRVITLWYRPPELLLGAQVYGTAIMPFTLALTVTPALSLILDLLLGTQSDLLLGTQVYGTAIDMWSAGCILAELLVRKPILPGTNEFNQLELIFSLLGTPTEATWPGVTKLQASHHTSLPLFTPVCRSFNRVWLDAHAQDLLSKLLCMDPKRRISAVAALDHEYFWTDPLPAKPEHLPKYPPSHEFTAKKRRQAAAAQGNPHQMQPGGPPAPMGAGPRHQPPHQPHHYGGYNQQQQHSRKVPVPYGGGGPPKRHREEMGAYHPQRGGGLPHHGYNATPLLVQRQSTQSSHCGPPGGQPHSQMMPQGGGRANHHGKACAACSTFLASSAPEASCLVRREVGHRMEALAIRLREVLGAHGDAVSCSRAVALAPKRSV
ncbi:MAG: hypothetical protein SGPRY_008132 [Prymnesium sp.]